MSEKKTAEEVLAELDKKTTSSQSDSKTAYYRKKKAQEFVQGYILVKELREADESGEKFTENHAVDLLVAHWEAKADIKEEEEI